jgi:isoleucyl-tRNA synthetase
MDDLIRDAYSGYDFNRIFHALFNFCTVDLSSFYFDIRKDVLYCDRLDSDRRRACRTVLDAVFSHLTAWFAPVMCFTMEEVWLTRFPSETDSVHLRTFPEVPSEWRDEDLAARWRKVRAVRRVVTGALEIERREGRIGSSLEAAPEIHVADEELAASLVGLDLAELCITSDARLIRGDVPSDAFIIDDVSGVGVVPKMADGRKCQRSWRILPEVGSHPEFPDLSLRDADAVEYLMSKGLWSPEAA